MLLTFISQLKKHKRGLIFPTVLSNIASVYNVSSTDSNDITEKLVTKRKFLKQVSTPNHQLVIDYKTLQIPYSIEYVVKNDRISTHKQCLTNLELKMRFTFLSILRKCPGTLQINSEVLNHIS